MKKNALNLLLMTALCVFIVGFSANVIAAPSSKQTARKEQVVPMKPPPRPAPPVPSNPGVRMMQGVKIGSIHFMVDRFMEAGNGLGLPNGLLSVKTSDPFRLEAECPAGMSPKSLALSTYGGTPSGDPRIQTWSSNKQKEWAEFRNFRLTTAALLGPLYCAQNAASYANVKMKIEAKLTCGGNGTQSVTSYYPLYPVRLNCDTRADRPATRTVYEYTHTCPDSYTLQGGGQSATSITQSWNNPMTCFSSGQ